MEAKADIYPAGHSRRTIRADLVRSMRPKILAAGIASERELDEVDHAVREHLRDPGTLMLPHLLILAWGRKPDGQDTSGGSTKWYPAVAGSGDK